MDLVRRVLSAVSSQILSNGNEMIKLPRVPFGLLLSSDNIRLPTSNNVDVFFSSSLLLPFCCCSGYGYCYCLCNCYCYCYGYCCKSVKHIFRVDGSHCPNSWCQFKKELHSLFGCPCQCFWPFLVLLITKNQLYDICRGLPTIIFIIFNVGSSLWRHVIPKSVSILYRESAFSAFPFAISLVAAFELY